MNKQNVVASTKELVLIAFLATILFVQEEVLTFFPNVQLTIFLLVLYSKKLGFKRTGLIIALHVLLDNLVMGSLNFFYTAFMFIGWKLIPLLLNTVFKKLDNCNQSSYFRNFIFFVVLLDIYNSGGSINKR